MNRSTAILSIEPNVVQRGVGWFAVSPPSAVLRVGVEAATERAARERFAAELQAWAALASLPNRSPEPPDDPYVS